MEPAHLPLTDMPVLAPHMIPAPNTFEPASNHSMFSALWNFLRSQFITTRSNSALPQSESSEVETQILSELAAAASKAGMVATRSQEHLEEFSPNAMPKTDTTKKRRLSELHPDLPDERISKRRAETPADNVTPEINGRHRSLIPIVSPSINNTNIPKDGIEVRVVNGGESRSLLLKSALKSDGAGRAHTRQRETRRVAKMPPISPVKQKTAEEFSSPASSIELPEKTDNEQLSPALSKAKHKRFGTEEIQEDDPLPLDDDTATFDKIAPPVKIQLDIESEDDEPETITTFKGLSEARSAANEAAKGASKYVIASET